MRTGLGALCQRSTEIMITKFVPPASKLAVRTAIRSIAQHVAATVRLDSNETAFLERELTQLRATLYKIQFPELKARMMLPKATDIAPSAPAFAIKILTPTGQARFVSYKGGDLPRADVSVAEELGKIHPIGMAYGYDINEMAEAARTNTPLAQWKGDACKEAMERGVDEVIAFGGFRKDDGTVPDVGLTGLVNNAAIAANPQGIVDGAFWLEGDVDGVDIVAEVGAHITGVNTNSKQIFTANTYAMPVPEYNYIAATPYSDQLGATILQVLQEAHKGVEFIPWYQLTEAGASSKNRGVVFEKAARTGEAIVPQEFQQMPPEWRGLEAIINCHQRVGGSRIYQPLGFQYVDFASS